MKKCAVAVCLWFLLCMQGFPVGTGQKIYPVQSDEYKTLVELYIMQGYALPSATGPWSGAELTLMLQKVDPNLLEGAALGAYNRLFEELHGTPRFEAEESLGFGVGITVNPALYAHTDINAFADEQGYRFDQFHSLPFLQIGLEVFAIGHFYGTLEPELKNNGHTTKSKGETSFASTIPALQNFAFAVNDIDINFPDRAFLAFGGDNWSAQIGRDRLSWGNGVTGNMQISDTLPYHNMARFSTFFNSFKYTYLLDFFPHPMNYGNKEQDSVTHGLRFYQAHRFEGHVLADKLSFAVTESIMYQSDDNTVDLSIINPLALYHNYYIRSMANSILGLEADYTVFPGLNVYAQVCIDDLPVIGEPAGKNSPTRNANPDAMGYLLGVKTTFPLKDGIAYGALEGAYTDPFLYLRDGGTSSKPIDFVVAVRRFSNVSGDGRRHVFYDKYFHGYRYGGDAIVGNLNFGWKSFRVGKTPAWGVEGNIFSMVHGTFDAETLWTRLGSDNYANYQTPTTVHPAEVTPVDSTAASRTGTRNTLDVGVNAYCYVLPALKLFAQCDLVSIWNYDYAGSNALDFQTVLGVTYRW